MKALITGWRIGESVINGAIRDVLGDDVEYNPLGVLKPGGKMHVAIQNGHNLFESGKGYDDAEGLRQKFSEELRRLTDIIDTLNGKERNV
ncbi:MAG: DUF3137 domain-containing protein [Robinsoniella sp.]|nr:DUF3137 domain-containing protein [Robinsoniella sp.]